MIEISPKAKALIFDLDGTVADTLPIHYKGWVDVLEEHKINFPRELFNEFTGIPTYKIVSHINEKFGVNLNPAETSKKKEEYCLKNINQVQLIKPVADIIYKYHTKMPISLGTGSTKNVTDIILEKLGLDKYFDIYVTADDVVNHKPAPDTFLRCAELMGVAPEFCQVFEDGDIGLQAAKSAGMIATDIRPYL